MYTRLTQNLPPVRARRPCNIELVHNMTARHMWGACGNRMNGGSWAIRKVAFYRSGLLVSESNHVTLKN